MRLYPIVLGALVPLVLWAEDGVRATTAELEAMTKSGRHAEALLHAEEVAVGQRNDRWRTMVLHAALGYLSQLASETSPGRDGIAVELQRRYAFLAHAKDFLRRRDEAITAGYRECVALQQKDLDCPARLEDRLAEAGHDSALVAQAVKEVAELQGAPAAKRLLEGTLQRAPASAKEKIRADKRVAPYL